MPGEGQFFLHGEDAHADSAVFFGSRVARQNECSFGEIHLARQVLHLLGAEAATIEENRQRITGESAVGKHVDLDHGEFSERG
jgi:hypothetical protein